MEGAPVIFFAVAVWLLCLSPALLCFFILSVWSVLLWASQSDLDVGTVYGCLLILSEALLYRLALFCYVMDNLIQERCFLGKGLFLWDNAAT